ncbi:MAG: Sec-independent protein translocase protein TatB [Cellvibrionaceae bacterium]
MFDIGFTEILLIAGVALFVVGPERLPDAVKTISLWIGRFKRGLRETRREIEQQIGADEIRRELHNEEIMQNLEKMRSNVNDVLNEDLLSGDDNHSEENRITEKKSDQDFYPEGHEDHDPNDDSAEKLLDAQHHQDHTDDLVADNSNNSILPDSLDPSLNQTKK